VEPESVEKRDLVIAYYAPLKIIIVFGGKATLR
jgi:hypothetical protein